MEVKEVIAKPFLRWAAGKSWLVNDIVSKLQSDFNNYMNHSLEAQFYL